MNGAVTEIVLYRLKPGVDRAAFLRDSARACAWLAERSGFTERELLETPEGQWMDIVRWGSLASAESAAAAFADEPSLKPLMAALDPETIRMLHAARVA